METIKKSTVVVHILPDYHGSYAHITHPTGKEHRCEHCGGFRMTPQTREMLQELLASYDPETAIKKATDGR